MSISNNGISIKTHNPYWFHHNLFFYYPEDHPETQTTGSSQGTYENIPVFS